MVLTRAFAAATPVVASDIDGYRQLVSCGCGSLVPPGDERALAAAIVSLLEDEARRRAYAGVARSLAADRYSWPGIAAQLRTLYERLLGDAQSGERKRLHHGTM